MPTAEYLLEVRTEEIPARMLADAAHELATRVFEELMGRGVGPEGVETGFTPRRLVLMLEGLPAKEPDREERVVGPPVAKAYDADGSPTAALAGFARRCGVEASELLRIRKGKGEYVAAVLQRTGRSTSEILAEIVPRVLRELSWPKTMRWGTGVGPWVRPVHGIVSLYDGEVLKLELFGVQAGDASTGHPILSPRPFKVKNTADYLRKLAARSIEVRFDDRRRKLEERLRAGAEAAGGTLLEDSDLLDKLASICEIPGVLQGSFDREFLVLPREVLTTSLRDHQSAFSVQQNGDLLPVFLTVMDRPDDPEGRVRAGNEWVVAARLADARFFYEEDRGVPLAERGRRLKHLVFHEQLGSYAAKAERLASLSDWLCQELGWSEEAKSAVEAAQLLKADLTTEMVKEFTSLQGNMGGIYAREEGYPEGLWQAIYDQYLPVSPSDPVPRGRIGKVTALADRIDSLVGIFGLGHVPSGSKDPFGLRRAAQGAVRIVLEGDLALDLDLMAARAARLYGETLPAGGEEILASLRPFLYDRVRYLLGLEGYSYDEVEAALAVGGSNLPDLRARVDALHNARQSESFLSVVLAAKRILNIIKDSQEFSLNPKLLQDEAEKSLYEAFQELRSDVDRAAAAGDYERCLQRIAELAPVLDRFFVEVLVMDENEQLKHNRLALLQSIHRTISRAARLTEVVVDKGEYRTRGGAG